MYFKGY